MSYNDIKNAFDLGAAEIEKLRKELSQLKALVREYRRTQEALEETRYFQFKSESIRPHGVALLDKCLELARQLDEMVKE